jgi:hypothetical protein
MTSSPFEVEYDGRVLDHTGGETRVAQALLPLARAMGGLPAVALAAMTIPDRAVNRFAMYD